MDKKIIQNWNNRVSPDDTVLHLGDFCFKNSEGGKPGEGTTKRAKHYLDQLNGNIIVVKGNHDGNNSMRTIINHMVIEYAGEEMFLCHDPDDFSQSYKINLVGHVHTSWKIKKIGRTILVNVGVDAWNYMPINIQEIFKLIEKFKKENKK